MLEFELRKIWGLDQIGTGSQARPASEWRQAKTLEDAVANPVAGQRMLRRSSEEAGGGRDGV